MSKPLSTPQTEKASNVACDSETVRSSLDENIFMIRLNLKNIDLT